MNQKLLENKVAIITGGSSGVGLCMGELFAEEGARVVLMARRQGPLDEAVAGIIAKGGKAIGVAGDVAVATDVKNVFAQAIEAFGKVDIVVNNAGKGSGSKSIEGTDDEFLDAILSANLRGPFLLCREAIDYYLPRKEGVIINVASVNAIRPITGAAYAASKAGLLGLTKNIAMRTVGTKIRVNCLCPGLTLTPMSMANTINADDKQNITSLAGAQAEAGKQERTVELGSTPESMFEKAGSMSGYLHARTNRFCACEPMDEAKAALFLASDLSSGVHGQALVVDRGGYL